MENLPGVYLAKKKNGTVYYRSSITYKSKHISLGSYSSADEAHQAYLTASKLLCSGIQTLTPEDYTPCTLSFSKWVVLTNFKNNQIYIKTPIYLRSNYFQYYLSQEDVLTFDVDDLFYYSTHSIMRRGNHLFVADYGMQVNIASRYGIKNFAVKDRDYRFVNGDDHDFRYGNIEIINSFHGVSQIPDTYPAQYLAKIHVNGDWVLGRYSTEQEAAIAYNKAADMLTQAGCKIQYTQNYLSDCTSARYAEIYHNLPLEARFNRMVKNLSAPGD